MTQKKFEPVKIHIASSSFEIIDIYYKNSKIKWLKKKTYNLKKWFVTSKKSFQQSVAILFRSCGSS